ncbi:IS701 family transposase [Streptomyces sp. NPDC059175]|uniref:IS701 family transposase n=1 Tax=unclassified Streptomyces TaxID=2593676 RepID=UPI0036871F0E
MVIEHVHDEGPGTVEQDVVADLAPVVFASLPRADQRAKAERYVRSLLAADGRKTLRSVAAQFGGLSARQSVHHFISGSSWEWSSVRHALARRAAELFGAYAWVVRPLFIPKSGSHSIGVEHQWVPPLGKTSTGQLAFGLWLVGESANVPVNWRIFLPERWLEDAERRTRSSIPARIAPASWEDCARSLLRGFDRQGTQRPLVLDAPGLDPEVCAEGFAGVGAPLLIRVSPTLKLPVNTAILPGYSARELPAGQLIHSLKELWRRTSTSETEAGRSSRGIAAVVPVLLGRRPMRLVAEWQEDERQPDRLWLTDSTEATVGLLVRAARQADVVEADFRRVSERVGVRDFAGRSFQGWHRHITLASVAHLAAVLSEAPARLSGGTGPQR